MVGGGKHSISILSSGSRAASESKKLKIRWTIFPRCRPESGIFETFMKKKRRRWGQSWGVPYPSTSKAFFDSTEGSPERKFREFRE